jgi:hypothetical protein
MGIGLQYEEGRIRGREKGVRGKVRGSVKHDDFCSFRKLKVFFGDIMCNKCNSEYKYIEHERNYRRK